jgi:transcriptional regulator with XRE-family HTH domain
VPGAKITEAICSEVARILKETRIERGLSMTEVATRAGLSRAMVSFVESEFRNPTLDTLLRITSVLEIEASKVLAQAELRASSVKRSGKSVS